MNKGINMQFKTIHTRYALSQITAAEASGIPINLPEMAIGDGNGNQVDPVDTQTTLVRERYRGTVNRVYSDPADPTHFTAELVIPASVGGFTMRETAVFDSDGSLFVVGNLPETYKPTSNEGAYSDTIVRVEFICSNASLITLQVDPNVAVATQTWITNNVTAAFILPGGTTHQVLRKKSNANGNLEWADQTDVNVTVNSIEETQTLAEGQIVIDWAIVTNTGLCIYVDGARLRADQWTKHETINTRITLKQTYSAGTKIIGAQNEPANSIPESLVKGENLNDIQDKSEARSNLGVYSKSETDQKAPSGAVIHFARGTAPSGWLKANGAAVSRIAYSNLFAAIGTTFGAGDGFNTFNLPDLRGEFIRGYDDGRGVDSGRAFGSKQTDLLKSHSHTTNWKMYNESGAVNNNIGSGGAQDESVTFKLPTESTGGTETRPRNVALLACIKY